MSIKLLVGVKGSSKSGNYGHAGRPGKVGGSAPTKKGSPYEDAYQKAGMIKPKPLIGLVPRVDKGQMEMPFNHPDHWLRPDEAPFPAPDETYIKANAKVSTLDPSTAELHSIQPEIEIPGVRNYMKRLDEIKQDMAAGKNLPLLVEYQNKMWILDGNHRLAAMKFMHQHNAKVRLVNVDGID